jgi:hypothetical protein
MGQCRPTRSADEQSDDTTEDNATDQVLERLLSHGLQDLFESSKIRTPGDHGLERELADQRQGGSKSKPDDATQQSTDDESGARGTSDIGEELGNAQLDDGYEPNKGIIQKSGTLFCVGRAPAIKRVATELNRQALGRLHLFRCELWLFGWPL